MARRGRATGGALNTALAHGAAGLEREAPPGTLVDLVYQDAEGRVSRRRVEVVRWSHARNGFTYLSAYCSLREEERTFRGDRVVQWQVVEREPFPPHRQPVAFVPIAPQRPSVAAPPATVPAAAPASTTPAPHPAPPAARRGGGTFTSLLGVAVTIVLVRALLTASEPPRSSYVPTPPVTVVVPSPKPAPKPSPRPSPKPRPVPDPAPDPSVPVDPAMTPGDRALAFRAATGIDSPSLEAIYRGADLDGNDALDWDELAAFQSRLHRTYAYRHNRPALRPDEFLAQGGGDCEDWALFTCGLLRWWGWEPYVGSFAPSDGAVGHAVCLVRLDERPGRFRWWSVDGDGFLGGYSVKAGCYVPVDYEKVGGLTNAVEEGWDLRAIWKPEAIYGEQM